MAAVEIVTTVVGNFAGKDVHVPTGAKGQNFPHVHDWIAGKAKAGISVREVTSSLLVRGGAQWAAYEEMVGNDTLLTIFEVAP